MFQTINQLVNPSQITSKRCVVTSNHHQSSPIITSNSSYFAMNTMVDYDPKSSNFMTGWWYTYPSEKICVSIGMIKFPMEKKTCHVPVTTNTTSNHYKSTLFIHHYTNQMIFEYPYSMVSCSEHPGS